MHLKRLRARYSQTNQTEWGWQASKELCQRAGFKRSPPFVWQDELGCEFAIPLRQGFIEGPDCGGPCSILFGDVTCSVRVYRTVLHVGYPGHQWSMMVSGHRWRLTCEL